MISRMNLLLELIIVKKNVILKTIGQFYIRILYKTFFGFAEQLENAKFRFGCKLAVKKIGTKGQYLKVVLHKMEKTVLFCNLIWHVPACTLKVIQQKLLDDHIVNEVPTDMSYIRRSVTSKIVKH